MKDPVCLDPVCLDPVESNIPPDCPGPDCLLVKLQFSDVLTQLHDSRPFQLGNDTVWRQEFDSAGENAQF